MRSPLDKPNAPLARGVCKTAVKVGKHSDNRTGRSDQVAVIAKSATSEIRIAIKTWRGAHKVEIREATAVIAGTYFTSGTPINFPVDRLGEFIAALQSAERQAIARGLIGGAR